MKLFKYLSVCAIAILLSLSCYAKEEYTIGYTVQSMENDYFVSVVEGMKKRADELGIKLIVADAAADASKHIDHIHNFAAQGVDAILISPVDQVAPESVVQETIEQGIPVISVNQVVDGTLASLLIKEYDYGLYGGMIAGEWLNDIEEAGKINNVLNSKGEIEVGVIRYDTITSLIDRGDGLKDGIKKTYRGDKKINFVIEQDGANSSDGQRIAETAFTAFPEICIFVCINDSSALGVFEAASARSDKNKDNMCIVGLDGLPQALKYISEDTMYKGTVDSLPGQLGADALDLALITIDEGKQPAPVIATMKTVDKHNINEYAEVIK